MLEGVFPAVTHSLASADEPHVVVRARVVGPAGGCVDRRETVGSDRRRREGRRCGSRRARTPRGERHRRPTWLPLVQGWVVVLGPHSVKVTVPVGAPVVALPLTVAVSVTVPLGPMIKEPSPELLADCWVLVVVDAGVTLTHSLASADGPMLSFEPRSWTRWRVCRPPRNGRFRPPAA